MKPNLYICHTAYQVLVDLLRAGRCAGKPHTMVLSASVPDTAALAARLDATGVVKTVLVDETRWPGTVTGIVAAEDCVPKAVKYAGIIFPSSLNGFLRTNNAAMEYWKTSRKI